MGFITNSQQELGGGNNSKIGRIDSTIGGYWSPGEKLRMYLISGKFT